MEAQGQQLDRKSWRAVTGRTADWSELAKDCVAFANAAGGRLLIGLEDGQGVPPPGQRLAALVLEDLRRYPGSSIGEVNGRIGREIHPRQLKRCVDALAAGGQLRLEGKNRWRRYWAAA